MKKKSATRSRSTPEKNTSRKSSPSHTARKNSAPKPKKTSPAASKKAALKRPGSAKKASKKIASTRHREHTTDHRERMMANIIVKSLEALKGKQITSLDVHHLTDVMDTMIIVSGTSSRHVKSLADNAVMEMKKNGYRPYGREGDDVGEWVLVDFGGVVLHVMQPHIREFYDLERLWSTPRAAGE